MFPSSPPSAAGFLKVVGWAATTAFVVTLACTAGSVYADLHGHPVIGTVCMAGAWLGIAVFAATAVARVAIGGWMIRRHFGDATDKQP